ncbi:DUF2333 family protein [Rhizobium oryzihabitans]|uniref:DUF2333 family protein n=2 Tax=Rhizobium TaxID=379 RepID=A0A7L5BJK1_9HYPH|nr:MULTISPECIES: DUF2333 family protein [Rhizobium]MCW0981510.1 DUF2333 family protein [Agrobacterium sp. BT-220-3]QCM05576.1 DUF2333 family protein [Agrobacterium tumefaciens]CUX27338.1 conserved hypothetical protein [Agrobacterium genomosp. 5 str. CFBP 6626]HBT68259.1 DUF2333 domain-containing protein [Agrobacterium sp.]QCM10738.1 DUF2333 family protein [Agrobacterium tumefaciens]
MIDRITALIQAAFSAIGRAAGLVVAWLLWPFMAAHGWYSGRNWIIKGPIALVLILLAGFYGYFVWQTQVWSNFDPDYISRYKLAERTVPPGQELPAATPAAAAGATGAAANTSAPVCQRSAIVDAAADLTDFNVNQNAWISSMLLYRLGLFGMDWDSTPFLDNKASFQRGVNQAVRRTSVELVDTLGRVRGTSGINNNLQEARGNMQFSEYSWYFGLDPFGPKTPTPSYYRAAIRSLQAFNGELVACKAVFDTRADNLIQFIDRIAGDIGSTSAILRERSENYNGGWFDTRADDRFWFAYGQLYGYYGVLSAAGSDFAQVIRERNLTNLWNDTLLQTRAALRIQPAIISNGEESGWIMPSHLATMGFYVLRVRSNLVELRSVLDR